MRQTKKTLALQLIVIGSVFVLFNTVYRSRTESRAISTLRWVSSRGHGTANTMRFDTIKYEGKSAQITTPDVHIDTSVKTVEIHTHLSAFQNITAANVSSKAPAPGKAKPRQLAFCKWSPEEASPTECHNVLSSAICSVEHDLEKQSRRRIGSRVLLLGDSTMGPNFLFRGLYRHLVHEGPAKVAQVCSSRYTCQIVKAERCRNNHLFGLEFPVNDTWTRPDFERHAEGPTAYGLKHPFCSDCAGCKSTLLLCNLHNATQQCIVPEKDNNNTPGLVHGGYINIEYARDVVMQSPACNTTQENIVTAFLGGQYNRPELVQDFGQPICVINTGHHDAVIRGITKDKFLSNVEWYLNLLDKQCELIVWLASTAPQTDAYAQTSNLTQVWNQGVRELLERQMHHKAAFIDVYEASKHFLHQDNIHMSPEWYSKLGALIKGVVSTVLC